MARPPGLDEWLKYADQTARNPEERKRMRADAYRRFGMEPPKRKRGGLAGLWDRNKNVIVPAASGLAALLTGGAAAPLAAAATGAAMRGADTKSLKGALGGAAEGYLSGLGASAVSGAVKGGMGGTGIRGMLSGAGRGAARGAGQYVGMGSAKASAPQTAAQPRVPGPLSDADLLREFPAVDAATGANALGETAAAAPSRLASLLKPEAIGGVTAGLGQALGGYMERRAGQERLDFERQRDLEEQRRANRLAELLAPMAGAQAGLIGAQYGGYGQR